MNKKENSDLLINNRRLIQRILFSSLQIVLCLIILSSCSQASELNEKIINTSGTLVKTQAVDTPIPAWSETPIPLSPIIAQNTIEGTQAPIATVITSREEEGILYNEIIVVFTFNSDENSRGYINLDDLNNNTETNSDLVLSSVIEDDLEFYLLTANGASFLVTDKHLIDFDYCLLRYSELSKISQVEYDRQKDRFMESDEYCVYTNENRIAIVSYLPSSLSNIDNNKLIIAVDVIVYEDRFFD